MKVKMVETIQNLNKKTTTKKIVSIAEILFYLYFFLRVCLNICYGVETPYQVNRDYYNFKAINYLLGVILVAARARVWHWWCLLAAGGYATGCAIYLHKTMLEWEMFRAVEMRLITYGLCGLILIDAIIRRNFVKWKDRNWWLTGTLIFAVVFSWLFSVSQMHLFCFLCPFTFIYLVKISSNVWIKLVNCLSVSYVASVFWVFGKSLLEVPYEGIRYYGVFLNLFTIGIFCAGAFICALYWFLLNNEAEQKFSWKFAVIIGVSVISLIMVGMVSSRNSMLTLVGVVFFVYICYSQKKDTSSRKKRLMIILGVASTILICGFVGLWGLYQIDYDELREMFSNDMIYNQVAYWHGRAKTMFNAESITFKHGTPMAMIDRFSSGRVGIWYEYIKNLNLLGHETEVVLVVDKYQLYAHNGVISNLYNYGIIAGGAFVCWEIMLLIEAVKKTTASNNIYLLPGLWVVFTLCAMFAETYYWIYPTPFIMLFLAYPFMNKIEEEKQKD